MRLSDFCFILAVPIRIAILQYIKDNGSVTIRDISGALFGAPTNIVPVRRHLRILYTTGLCQRIKIGRELYYAPAAQPEAVTFAIQQLQKLFELSMESL